MFYFLQIIYIKNKKNCNSYEVFLLSQCLKYKLYSDIFYANNYIQTRKVKFTIFNFSIFETDYLGKQLGFFFFVLFPKLPPWFWLLNVFFLGNDHRLWFIKKSARKRQKMAIGGQSDTNSL
ncbi:hypothetical protein SAMN05421780_1184 [Flexibacter flexilis DSM 6793]|uniref:Uncharacterized protein n=1 Tax=Flexibacter flexilis DSM 6793 TaxID=927664 RepID=A0A1I1NQL4_9BACT|nr:hypothetical protein SAMN05421780_1184 [Flexibacter flexilis DSM 6793]